jgi:hypothetical protein
MTIEEMNELYRIGEKNETVRIIEYCLEKAMVYWQRDGDKIPSYGEGEKAKRIIYGILGCRTHGIINCQMRFCKLPQPLAVQQERSINDK